MDPLEPSYKPEAPHTFTSAAGSVSDDEFESEPYCIFCGGFADDSIHTPIASTPAPSLSTDAIDMLYQIADAPVFNKTTAEMLLGIIKDFNDEFGRMPTDYIDINYKSVKSVPEVKPGRKFKEIL